MLFFSVLNIQNKDSLELAGIKYMDFKVSSHAALEIQILHVYMSTFYI